MIPTRVFWLLDTCVSFIAFLTAAYIVPILQAVVVATPVLASEADGMRTLPSLVDLLWIFFTMTPVAVLVLAATGNHKSILLLSRSRIIVGSLLAPLTGVALITLALFALKAPGWSRLFIFSYTGLSCSGLFLYRFALRTYQLRRQSQGFDRRNVVVIGPTDTVELIVRLFESIAPSGYALLGYFRISKDEPLPVVPQSLEVLGHVNEVGDVLVHRPIHDVILIQPARGGEWIAKTIRDCDYFGVSLSIVPEPLLFFQPTLLKTLFHEEFIGLPAVVLSPREWNSEALFAKRILDIVISSTLLVLLTPIFAIVGLAIKLTTPSLSIFYRWRVVGKNGIEFTGYKFTTMIANADDLKEQLREKNEMQGPVFKIKNDPRVTRLGRFLRKYSINELPQLWSVLKGDMSLVGPRPAFRHELARYEFWHKRKLSISPGITCLWQVSGRNRISNFDDWVKLDLQYIDNWSLWLDFKILVRTAWAVISGTGS